MVEILTALKDSADEIARALFVRSDSIETKILAIILVLAVVVAFKIVAGVLTGNKGRSLFVLVPGFVLMLGGAAVVRAFFSDSPAFQVTAAVLVLVFIVLPLTQAVQDTSYLSSVCLWVVVLLTVLAVFQAEPTLVRELRKGVVNADLLVQHRVQSEQYFR